MSDASVLIVDANFLAPAVHQKYSVSPENGLRDWEPAGSKCVIHAIAAHPRLSVITAGSANGRSLHTLQRNGFLERLAAQLRQDFRYVLWDTAPLIPYPDGRYLLRHVDGVVVVVESDGTTIESLAEFNSVLAESSAQILGVIMNRLGRYAIGARPSASRLQHRISS
jgi:Mrp family chromosome partitioning ATPase